MSIDKFHIIKSAIAVGTGVATMLAFRGQKGAAAAGFLAGAYAVDKLTGRPFDKTFNPLKPRDSF